MREQPVFHQAMLHPAQIHETSVNGLAVNAEKLTEIGAHAVGGRMLTHGHDRNKTALRQGISAGELRSGKTAGNNNWGGGIAGSCGPKPGLRNRGGSRCFPIPWR